MKTIINTILASVLCFALVGCERTNNNEDSPISPSSSIKCNPNTIENDGTGGTYSVTLTSSKSWTATTNCSWVTFSPESGQGDAFISISVEAGPTDSAKVMFSNGTGSATLTIKRIVVSEGVENGHAWVDLGLSVRWATMNVGASSETDNGTFYAWGETTPRPETYTEAQYSFYDSSTKQYTKYVTNSRYGVIDNKRVLVLSDDVAHVKWGGKWRMPTKEEFEEFAKKCSNEREGDGYRITGPNSNTIYMPWVQYAYGGSSSYSKQTCLYWCSTVDEVYNDRACSYALVKSYDPYAVNSHFRNDGLLVRPVCDK